MLFVMDGEHVQPFLRAKEKPHSLFIQTVLLVVPAARLLELRENAEMPVAKHFYLNNSNKT